MPGSGVDAVSRPLPGGGGGMRSSGDGFRPNLAMGGGSNRIPIELPHGPGGVTPKIDLLYNTGLGAGLFGMGWTLSIPFVERLRPSPFSPLEPDRFLLSGAEPLVDLGGGRWAPTVGTQRQLFTRAGDGWMCRTPDLLTMTFGADPQSRLAGSVDGIDHVARWYLDTVTFPNGVEVTYQYKTVDGEHRPASISWSAFRLSLDYETRPDPSTSHALGFAVPFRSRCRRLLLQHSVDGPPTDARAWVLSYAEAPSVGSSLLSSVVVVGWHDEDGTTVESRQAPISFGYTTFDPSQQRIRRFTASTTSPPPLGGDVTIMDHLGTALPGVLRMARDGATYWENRGEGRFGPPQSLRRLAGGVSLAEDPVRFADITGNGTADLLVGDTIGGSWFEHDPDQGFLAKRQVRLAPGFGLNEEEVVFLDLDGDGVVDVLTFRNGTPFGFMNDGRGRGWRGPFVLPWGDLPPRVDQDDRLRFADMTGDGLPDLVLLRSQAVVYWPNLGGGRIGEPVVMADTPALDVPDPARDAYLADVDGDGTADLVLVGGGQVRIHLNQGGGRFGPAIEVDRTPPLSAARMLLVDMTGSGNVGLLWTMSPTANGTAGYLHLDLLGGVKPYLLASVDNGAGLRTEISYTTSAFERARDLAEGRRWTGYLPFPVHVISAMSTTDTVTGQSATTTYRYHDGHFDGRTRQWLGFAEVEAMDLATAHEAASLQRLWFHNRVESAGVPAFEAGRGQPHRTEVVDPATGNVHSISSSTWSALPADAAAPTAGAWLALERERTSTRLQGGVPYARERLAYEHDDVGNVVRETRRGLWSDEQGDHDDELVIERRFAQHAAHGLTSIPVRERKVSGARLLKAFDWFYDGPDFVGLAHGQVARGFLSRQTEVALTPQMRADAYGTTPPGILDDLYRVEVDPVLGTIHVHDTRRYRCDAHGNQVETIDALGQRVAVAYDALGLTPVSTTDAGRPARAVRFDPVVQQAVLIEDANGHELRTRFDGLGEIVAVWRRGANPARPTETYEHDRASIPHRTIQRLRVRPSDATPGWNRHSHHDGAGRPYHVRTRARNGWAVEQTKVTSIRNRETAIVDCYDATDPDFDPDPPAGTVRHDKHYDFAGRLVAETIFGGQEIRYVHDGGETHFFDPEATAALALDPDAPPSRTSRTDAWGRLVSVTEYDGTTPFVERRVCDALGQLVGLVDASGAPSLVSVLDGWSNRIRVTSADSGVTRFVLDADSNEIQRIDAEGRVVHHDRDVHGRDLRIRSGGPAGPVEDTFVYDAGTGDNLIGRLVKVSGRFGSVEYSYDDEGNPARMRTQFAGEAAVQVTGLTYDSQGHVRSVTYPDGHMVTYDYDDAGLIRSIPGIVDDVEHGPHGKRTRIRFANGLEARREFTPGDHLLRELALEVVASGPQGHAIGTLLQRLLYDLDAVGRVTAVADQSTVTGKVRNNQTFAYDSRNRLASATGTGPGQAAYSFDYTYDPGGNLVDGETFAGMVHGRDGADLAHPNRMIRRGSSAGLEYVYDASGNLTSDPELGALEYDARHRLVRVTRPNGVVVEFDYDHHDRRVTTRVTDGGLTRTRHEVESLYVIDDAGSTKVVFDEDRRLALIPSTGDALVHHLDRLGNVNVLSNLATGAFVGGSEYTPWGALATSIVLQPQFTFAGAMLTDGLDIVLLGQRWYRPGLGRFLTADGYLLVHQDKIVGLHGGANLYLYALDNPANFSDPTGRIAFLVILLVAAIVGAIIGAVAAAVNGVETWDEFLLWVVGGAIGGMLAVIAWTGIIVGVAAIFGLSVTVAAAAAAGIVIFTVAGLLGAIVTPLLDNTNSPVAWFFSFLIKWVQSPITTTVGLISAIVVAIGGGNVDFRRGMLFIEVGAGGGALTLGAVAWTQSGRFNPDGTVPDNLARHESQHSRTVAAIGELGFYFTYVTIGAIWGIAEGGSWNDLNPGTGCGNPFEKTAHTFTNDPGTAVSTGSC